MRWHWEETPKHQTTAAAIENFQPLPNYAQHRMKDTYWLNANYYLFLNWSTVDGTVLCQFQVYNLVIQHLNTLRNDPHKSSNHLAAYKVITVLLTIFLMLYITFLWYFFYNWKFVPLNPIHLYHPSLHPSAFWQLPVCSLDLSQFLFCFACWSTIQ